MSTGAPPGMMTAMVVGSAVLLMTLLTFVVVGIVMFRRAEKARASHGDPTRPWTRPPTVRLRRGRPGRTGPEDHAPLQS